MPWMNLVPIDTYKYAESPTINYVHASPTVAAIVTTKPIMIEFFRPRLSSMMPTIGENIRAATSNDLYINQ